MTPCVHIISPSLFPPDKARNLLDEEELDRAGRFLFERDRDHWVSCRAALKSVLAEVLGMMPEEVTLLKQPGGKPVLAGDMPVSFNLTHCHDLALLVTGQKGYALGIDIEPASRAGTMAGSEATFCHRLEIATLPQESHARQLALLALWTAKEAFLKALGTGLSFPPTEVAVSEKTGTAYCNGLPGLGLLRLHRLCHPLLEGYLAAVACPEDLPPPRLAVYRETGVRYS